MSAILFGSISTLADTSELQRAAFNQAFTDNGLDWHWGRDEYRTLLDSNGGAARVASYAKTRAEDVDADAVHHTKSTIFQHTLASSQVTPRPGVLAAIHDAKQAGFKVGFVTTTSKDNIAALFAALEPELSAADFDVIVSASDVEAGKPDPAAYLLALRELGEAATTCVAVEDNVGGVQAAAAAGLTCLAFPNENTAGHDFGATTAVDRLDFESLKSALAAA